MIKSNRAVSPVIATILMVAITVVLAGVLVVYLQTLPNSGGNVEQTLGLRAERQANNNWMISVLVGSQPASMVTVQVINPTTGAYTYSHIVNVPDAANFTFNDNDNDTKLDVGDTIIIKDTATVDSGMKVQFLKSQSIIGIIAELPS